MVFPPLFPSFLLNSLYPDIFNATMVRRNSPVNGSTNFNLQRPKNNKRALQVYYII